MKQLFLLSFILVGSTILAQTMAPVFTTVKNDEEKPLQGEKIIFTGQTNEEKIIGISDENGEFLVELPDGDVYNIVISTIGKEEKFNTIEIPKAGEGQQFSKMNLAITIIPPKFFTLDNVYFSTGKSDLLTSSFSALDVLVEYLTLKPSEKIEIGGHTDNVGEEDANQKLSLARANSVKKYLESKEIASDRITTKGYGETQPVADNSTAEGRKQNRRTEVRIL